MKFVKVSDKKSEIMKFKNHEPLKVRGRDVCAVHNDTDSRGLCIFALMKPLKDLKKKESNSILKLKREKSILI